MKLLAIIPARGGSKGVPGKNIYPVCGKPLIQYTVEAVVEAGIFDGIYVSSDDEKILDAVSGYPVSKNYRPADLATDSASIIPVVEYILELAEKENNCTYDIIALFQPTSPMREKYHITGAVDALAANANADGLISVCEMTDVVPARMYNIVDDRLKPFVPEYEQMRRQDIPPVYYRNGSMYMMKRDAFVQQHTLMAKGALPYVMPAEYLLNIDEPRDIIIAEALIAHWKSNGK